MRRIHDALSRPPTTGKRMARSVLVALLLASAPAWGVSAARGDVWVQINDGGFGSSANSSIRALAVWAGHLYAGTGNDSGGQIWRATAGENDWLDVTPPWEPGPTSVGAMAVFDDSLYAGTDSSQVWRRSVGFIPCDCEGGGFVFEFWSEVTLPDDWSASGIGITSMVSFGSSLYVAKSDPVEIWRYDGADWTRVVSNGFDDPANNYAAWLAVHDHLLYAGTTREMPGEDGDGGEVWRMDGGVWSQVNDDGFGDAANAGVISLASFRGALFAGTVNHDGAQIWRDDGEWSERTPPGFPGGLGFNFVNPRAQAMAVLARKLYVGQGNPRGIAPLVWATRNGNDDWFLASEEGFGNGDNRYVHVLLASYPFLYASTENGETGAEIWKRLPDLADMLPALEPISPALRALREDLLRCRIGRACLLDFQAASSSMSDARDVFRVVQAPQEQELLLKASIGRLDRASASVAEAAVLVAGSNTVGSFGDRGEMRARANHLLGRAEHLVRRIVAAISNL